MKFKIKYVRQFLLFFIPIFAVLGFTRGCARSAEDAAARVILQSRASATLAPDALTLHFPDVPSVLSEWTHTYTNLISSSNRVLVKSQAISMPVATDALEIAVVAALGAAFGKVVEDPSTHEVKGVQVSRLAAFAASFMGYLPGYHVALKSGVGLKPEITSSLVKDDEFRAQTANKVYQEVAGALIKHRGGRGKLLSNDDYYRLIAFVRLSKPTEGDRAWMHSLVWKYLSQPSTRSIATPSQSDFSVICNLVSVVSVIVWLICVRETLKSRTRQTGGRKKR